MSGYYDRQIKLVGEERQNLLKAKHIAVIGCGGLGCSIAIALGSSGIGAITLIDFDTIAIHNIHRQIAFTLQDVDKYKAEALGKFLSDRNGEITVRIIKRSFEESIDAIENVDLLLDATDNLQTRESIDRYAKESGIPWVYASVEEWGGQVCFFEKASFDSFKIKQREIGGVSAPMVINIASFSALLALKFLLGYNIRKDFLYVVSAFGETIEQKSFFMPVK